MSTFLFDPNDGFSGFNAPATPADGCTQCGMCLPACPTFRQSEDVNQSPMARIRFIRKLDDDEALTPEETAALESCLACYACEAKCPSRVDYRTMLDGALEKLHEKQTAPRLKRLMLALSLKPVWLRLLTGITAVAQCFGLRALLRGSGLLKLTGLARADRLLGRVSMPEKLHNRVQRPRYDQRVNLFRGCFSSVLEQEIQQDAIEVLNALSIEVVFPEQLECCGALHRHNGDNQTALNLALHNSFILNAHPASATLFSSSGCGSSLQDYGHWLGAEPSPIKHPVMDLTHYIYSVLQQRRVIFNRLPLKVALHTPCTLKHGEGQVDAVNEALALIPELEVTPLSGEPACCGAGGTQMLTQPEMADGLSDRIIDEIKALDADVLLTSNLGCRLHLQASLKRHGLEMEILHPVQLLQKALEVEFVSVKRP